MVKAVSFSRHHHNNQHQPKAMLTKEHFAELNDYDLYQLAQYEALNNKRTKNKKIGNNILFAMVPIAEAFSNALHPANLEDGTITKSFSKFAKPFKSTLLSWGAIIGAFGLVQVATNKSEKLSQLEEKNPLAKLAIDLGAVVGGLSVVKAVRAAKANNLSEEAIKHAKEFVKHADKARDASGFAEKVYKPIAGNISKFAKSHKGIAKVLKKATPYLGTAAISLYALKVLVLDPIKVKNDIDDNFIDLKMVQNEIRKSPQEHYEF